MSQLHARKTRLNVSVRCVQPAVAAASGGLKASSLFGEGDTIDPLARAAAEEAENERKVRCVLCGASPAPGCGCA